MAKIKEGDRVGAILSYKNGVLELLGYGTFIGNTIPEVDSTPLIKVLKEFSIPNPTIKLDSGKVIYGAECWWGPEEDVKKYEQQADKILTVEIDRG
jgi:hypothetical protein